MFVYAIVIALLIGFVLKGSLKNLGEVEISAIYLVVIGFGMDAIMHFMGKLGLLSIGSFTYYFDLLMYILIFVFVYINKKNVFILIMGLGFLLNATAIFSNGGVMPVSQEAMTNVAMTQSTASEGLYKLADSSTRLFILCDIFSSSILGKAVVSIGDMITGLGIMLFIITGMRRKKMLKAE